MPWKKVAITVIAIALLGAAAYAVVYHWLVLTIYP